MIRRRELLALAAAAVTLDGKAARTLSHKERVDRALEGKDVDWPPFSFWDHFGLKTPEAQAKATLDFHAKYRTDIVKVMSTSRRQHRFELAAAAQKTAQGL